MWNVRLDGLSAETRPPFRLSDAATERTGIVRWSMSASPAEGWRAGIQFVTEENAWNGLRY